MALTSILLEDSIPVPPGVRHVPPPPGNQSWPRQVAMSVRQPGGGNGHTDAALGLLVRLRHCVPPELSPFSRACVAPVPTWVPT